MSLIPSRVVLWLACAPAVAGHAAHADDASDDERMAAAEVSVNPLPVVTKLKFEPSYRFWHDGTRSAQLLFESELPYQGMFVPGLDVAGLWSVARIQLTAEMLQNSNGTSSGLENLNFVDLAAYRFGSLSLGVGFGTVFPMATSSELGPAKWQLGPALGFFQKLGASFTLGGLAQALWSVAGSSDVADRSYVTVQPLLTLYVLPGLFLKSDAEMSFYWEGGSTTAPVDLGVGYAFSKQFVGTLKGTLTVAGENDGAWKATAELTFLP